MNRRDQLYCLDTLDFHIDKLKLRLLVWTGELNCNIKLYTEGTQDGTHLLGLEVEADPGTNGGDAGDDEEAVAPAEEVHVRPGHPLPVLAHLGENRAAYKCYHC